MKCHTTTVLYFQILQEENIKEKTEHENTSLHNPLIPGVTVVTSPCGPLECRASWCGTAWARKLPLRKAPDCVYSCGARRWSSWRRGRCSSPASPSYRTCGGEYVDLGLIARPRAWVASRERTGADDGDVAAECDTKVKPASLMLPGPGHVYSQSKDSRLPEVHGGPPCRGGWSWGGGCCDGSGAVRTCGSLHLRQHWSTGSCACGRTFWADVSPPRPWWKISREQTQAAVTGGCHVSPEPPMGRKCTAHLHGSHPFQTERQEIK